MRQQCGAKASGPSSSCEPGAPRSQALVLELPRLSRGQTQRAESVRAARVALAQLRLVATPPDGPRRVRAKIVNSTSWGLRRSRERALFKPHVAVRNRGVSCSHQRRPTDLPLKARECEIFQGLLIHDAAKLIFFHQEYG